MQKPIYFLIFTVFLLCCKSKKEKEEENPSFFPALSFIKSQVAQVDTSIYRIIKIVQKDSTVADTTYLKREEFRKEAKDFLLLPDISSDKLKNDYTESKWYDENLQQVVLNY